MKSLRNRCCGAAHDRRDRGSWLYRQRAGLRSADWPGPIAPRGQDHLGQSDVLVLLLRRIWERELRALAVRPLQAVAADGQARDGLRRVGPPRHADGPFTTYPGRATGGDDAASSDRDGSRAGSRGQVPVRHPSLPRRQPTGARSTRQPGAAPREPKTLTVAVLGEPTTFGEIGVAVAPAETVALPARLRTTISLSRTSASPGSRSSRRR